MYYFHTPTSHHPIFPKKSLGQNFLVNQAIVDKIIAALDPLPEDEMVEIGPGLGALTCSLLPLTKKLTAIEIDQRLIPELKAKCQPLGTLTLFQQDVLTFDFASLSPQELISPNKLRIVGNLPYSISTPLIFHLLAQVHLIKDMCFMLQKEVADRISAPPGNKAYGRLSVMVQYHCKTQKLFNVSAGSFHPRPKVESAVIKLIPFSKPPYLAQNFETFKLLVRQAFSHRRKMLSHTLKKLAPKIEIPWESLNIDPRNRPETLSVEDFVKISNLINQP